jgi:DinB superfamily
MESGAVRRRGNHMKETAQQYTQRILSHIAGQDALKAQAATAKKIAKLLKGAGAAKLRKRPAPDKWSVAEILAHLADAEIVISWRLRSILGAPGMPVQAYDQDTWVTALHYERRDARKSLEQFRVLREANLALYKSLVPEQWKHHGLHAERGTETIEHISRLTAGHDLNHLSQIERIVAPKRR